GDDLRERRNHDRPAEVRANGGNFLQDLLESVLYAKLCQLGEEVADHAAWHLVYVAHWVVFSRPSEGFPVSHRDPMEMLRNLAQLMIVEFDAVPHATQVANHGFGIRKR